MIDLPDTGPGKVQAESILFWGAGSIRGGEVMRHLIHFLSFSPWLLFRCSNKRSIQLLLVDE